MTPNRMKARKGGREGGEGRKEKQNFKGCVG